MATYEFSAKVREAGGKKGARGLRRNEVLPAVVYGRGEAGLKVEVSAKDVPLLFLRTLGKNSLLTMNLTDEKGATKQETVMFKEVQREPVKNKFLHVDFYHVDPKHPLKLKVPVVLEGVPVGVKEQGGILQHPTRNVQVKCLPADIPAEIRVNVSELKQDESILLRDFTPPKGVTFISGPLTVLAQVAAVVEEKAPEVVAAAEGAAAAGPEVITAKKPGEEAKAGDAKADPKAAAGKDAKAAPAAKAPAKK
jgi:large subunit ribosomal protein L25